MKAVTANAWRYGAAALAALGGAPALAQSGVPASGGSASPGASVLDKRVSIDADDMKLSDAVRKVMDAAGLDFAIDASLRSASVTAHLSDVKLKVALDTLMKVSTQPAEYKLDHGVYRIAAHVDAPATPETSAPVRHFPAPPRSQAIKIANVDPGMLAQVLDGHAFLFSPDGNAIDPTTGHWSQGSMSGSQSFSTFGFTGGGLTSSSSGGNYNYGPGGSSSTGGLSGGGYRFGFGPIHIGRH